MVAVELARLQQAMTQNDERAEKPQHFKADPTELFVHPLRRWFMLH